MRCAKIVVRCSRDCGEVQQRLCKDCSEVVNNWLVNLRRAITMPSFKPCKKAGLKGETANELTADCEFEFNRVHPRS